MNKAAARRRLPRNALTRAVSVEVPAAGDLPEEPHPALKVKVWIGLLDSSLET